MDDAKEYENSESKCIDDELEDVVYSSEEMIEVFKRIANDDFKLEGVYKRIKDSTALVTSSPKQISK